MRGWGGSRWVLAAALAASALGCNTLLAIEDGKRRATADAGSSGGGGDAPAVCGDERVAASEGCDDGNTRSGDGCSPGCEVEPGYACEGEPSDCAPVCGDGAIVGSEGCDDGNASAEDGCSAGCEVEHGYACDGEPSACAADCGDGVVAAGAEGCDDGERAPGDGCDESCKIELGYTCHDEPSDCSTSCGDGQTAGLEACDDGNGANGDGCSGCGIEAGFTCEGAPSACSPVCGDGLVVKGEACDDGNTSGDDCCSAACAYEPDCERESNDNQATANDLAALAPGGVLKAWIRPGGDRDIFSFAIAPGQLGAVTAATLDGFAGSTCTPETIDTWISITGANAVTSDDDSGAGHCSLASSRILPPGGYFVEIRSGDAAPMATFDYTLALAVDRCGDSLVTGGEQCDDGNATSGDGCNELCRPEAQAETEPNDTIATESGPFLPDALIAASSGTQSDSDYFAIDVPATADLHLETADFNGLGHCLAMDTTLRLYAPDGTWLATDLDSGTGPCSKIDGTTSAAALHLPPGKYHARVTSESGLIFGYRLFAGFDALCGNGVVEGSEECDGTPGCAASCDRVPTCGDGFVDAPEACDDGNSAGGDGCNATCTELDEVEPNDTMPLADGLAAGGSSLRITGSTILHGAIGAMLDKDVFRMELAQTSVVRIESFDGTGADCPAPLGTTLRLFDATGLPLGVDNTSGIGTCAAFVMNIAAGTYYVSIEETANNALVPAYTLEVSVIPSAGGETEVNDAQVAANALSGTELHVSGSHQANGDIDYFTIDVPNGRSLRAEVVEGDAETCESSGVDSKVSLYTAAGVLVASDDDSGRGRCSLIDGTGASPASAAAHDLPGGKYYVAVSASPNAQASDAGKFEYELVLTLR